MIGCGQGNSELLRVEVDESDVYGMAEAPAVQMKWTGL